jgi:hypothetical protein
MPGDEARHIALRAQLVASTQYKHVANPLMTASGHFRLCRPVSDAAGQPR